jgi:hypothetical protein
VEPETTSVEDEENAEESKKEMKVKILQRVEKFVGPDLEILGPFETDEVVTLPSEISKELVQKGIAEKFGSESEK